MTDLHKTMQTISDIAGEAVRAGECPCCLARVLAALAITIAREESGISQEEFVAMMAEAEITRVGDLLN
jgi:hypothetical protein